MYKHYYNGKLVRTSKNHEYHYAVFNTATGNIRSCHATFDRAVRERARVVNEPLGWIANEKEAIKALKSGKPGYFAREGNRNFFIKFEPKDTVETWEQYIKNNEERHSYYSENLKVVELEIK